MTPRFVLGLVLALALGAAALPALADEGAAPRNVILFIGDGMGPSQITLGQLVRGGPLALDSIGRIGLVRTASATGPVTDSAAAVTAIASGVKTLNKMLGVDPEGRPVRAITEDLMAAGWSVGVVTTTRVTHATPAGFYAHTAHRDDEAAIAGQLIESGLTLALGGGARYFKGEAMERRIAERGFTVVRDAAGLRANARGARRLLGLFSETHLNFEIDRRDEPSLEDLTRAALERLRGPPEGESSAPEPPPWFLMVEGGRIDQACHGHDAPAAARDMIAFDQAVGVGLEEARRDPRTLVLVTADHATGGLAISELVNLEGFRRVRGSAMSFIARAEGSPQRLAALVRENAIAEFSEADAEATIRDDLKYAHAGRLAHLISSRLGVWFAFPPDVQETYHSTEGHDGTMVPIYAEGPGAERFGGTIDQIDIAKRLREMLLERKRALFGLRAAGRAMIETWFRSRRKTKVELHVHMDGAIRVETFLDVARRRGIELPTRTPEGLRRYVQVPHDCRSLTRFLETFNFFLPIVSDAEAVERIAYEMCEDEARQGVRYFEARFSPHVLMTETFRPAEVVERALAGLKKGQERFGVTARAILCCMRHRPDWSLETVDLAVRYRDEGVAAIDLAGDETHFSGEPHAAAFRRAREAGLPATVHAGEAGPAANVREALDLLHARRIGHGYHVVDDGDLYARVRSERVPLECCLTSSLQTGAVPSLSVHPVRQFLKDGANFSLSTDDPGVSGIDLEHEYRLAAEELGLTPAQAREITFSALEAAFLPAEERARLRREIEREWALELVEAARTARMRAYAPYSRFTVGAAVLTDAGIFTGVNVENASYPLSVCAERNAIAAAVGAGARKVFSVAVIADTARPVPPCGGCRQVIREFGPDAEVHLANVRGDLHSTTLRALLPEAFGPENLGVRP